MPASDYALDLDKILASKFKGKKIPKVLVSALKKFFHVDFLNDVLSSSPGEGVVFCRHVVEYLDLKLEVSGIENVPADGTLYTFASNHPLGGADGVALCSLIGERFGNVRMPVNDFLMYVKPLAPLCVPINKFGAQLRNLPALLDEAFGSTDQILVFPAGLCSRMIDGRVQDLAWTKTFVKKSVESGRSIVPVHFIGENSRFFYRLTNLSKKLGVKFNIGMLCLPNELYKSRHKSYRIVFGRPVPCGEIAGMSVGDAVARIRNEVYSLL